MHNTKKFRRYRFLINTGFVAGMWSLGSGALWFMLPQIIAELTGSLELVGLFVAIPGFLALIVDVPIGDLADKIGRKKVIVSGLIALTLIGVSMNIITDAKPLALLLVLLGLSYPAVFIPLIAYVMDYTPKTRESEFMGAEFSFIQLGFALGPIMAGTMYHVLDLASTNVLAIIYSTAMLIALFSAVFIFREQEHYHGVLDGLKDVIMKDKVYLKELGDFSKLRSAGFLLLVSTLILSIYDGVVWTLEPIFYSEVTDNAIWGGIILSAFVVPLIIFEIPAGILADMHGRHFMLYMGLLVTGIMTWMFSIADNPFFMMITAFMASTGVSLAWPSLEGIMTVLSPVQRRGETIGVWGLARDTGYVVGPLVGGFVASRTSITLTFQALSIVLVASSAFGMLGLSRKPDEKAREEYYRKALSGAGKRGRKKKRGTEDKKDAKPRKSLKDMVSEDEAKKQKKKKGPLSKIFKRKKKKKDKEEKPPKPPAADFENPEHKNPFL